MRKFALAGNPNCGKTTLFNNLTGSTAHVGNWPGVTVDKREGTYKKLEESVDIVDLPGIYSLSPYTPEEVIARNYIIDEKPDCVINIVDATNLERNLYLTTQLLEMDVPVVIALNMMDAVEKNGDKIDAVALEKKIGVPVIGVSALKGTGLDTLMKRAYEFCKAPRQGFTVLQDTSLTHLIGDVKIALEGQGIESPLYHAIKLVENDEIEAQSHKDTMKMVNAFKKTFNDNIFGNDFEALIADARYKYIAANYSSALTKKTKEKFSNTKSDKVDKVLTHKIWGIPIFLVILFAVFHLTFSEDLFFLGGIFGLPTLEDLGMDGEKLGTQLLATIYDGAIFSPGVFLTNVLNLILDSISGLIGGWLETAPVWVQGFILDGVIGGLFAILGFLPQILVLFLFFSILEDSGYMARIAFILDRMFRKFGLSGRAFLPMIMGFGCSVPAMINTRTLADEKERTATIRVIPFFSCGAKLPILLAIGGAIISMFWEKGNTDIITYSMYILGIIVAILTVLIMRATSLKGETPPFIMELPAYHAPQFKNLMLHLWDKTKHFVKKAFTIILASTIIIWVLSHFSFAWKFLEDEQINESILASIGMFLQPIFTPLGFGSQLSTWGWVFAVAGITGLIAKENVIATFGALAACIAGAAIDVEAEGGDVLAAVTMAQATGITVPALLAFIVFNMTTIPCFAAVATAKAEHPTTYKFTNTLWFWIITSYIVSTMVYVIGSWWWTAFIFAAVIAILVVCIRIINKKQKAAA